MKDREFNSAGAVPRPIVDTLRQLIRRTRWLIVLRGVCAVIIAALSALLVVMAIDAGVTIFSPSARWALSLSAYAATILAALWFLVRPLARSFTLTGMARVIEARHPELQERISSAVELLMSADAPELRGSEQLISALVGEAAVNARQIQPRREITLRAATPFLIALAVALAAMGGVLIAWPKRAPFLLARASAPFVNLPNVQGWDLRVTPGDAFVLEGQRMEIVAIVANRAVRNASIRRLQPDGKETAEEMVLLTKGDAAERRFAFTCPQATEGFRYRIHAGDALSRYYEVTVVQPPSVAGLYVRYEYPSYTRKAPVVQREGDGNIRALAGTTVTVVAKPNRIPASAELLINGSPAPGISNMVLSGKDAPACTFRFQLAPELAGRWVVNLKDKHGFTGSSPERTIEVVPDLAPTAKIVRPEEKTLRLAPTARIPVSYAVEDDIGLSKAELLIEVDGKGCPALDVPLAKEGEADPQAAVGETALDLSRLMLKGARRVTFQLRASDSLPPARGPQHGLSELHTVELDVRAPTYAEMQLGEQELRITNTLQRVDKELQAAQQELRRLKPILARPTEPNEKEWEQVEKVDEKLGDAADDAQRTARQMEEGFFKGLSDDVEELASYIGTAQALVQQIPLAKKPAERAELAQKADEALKRPLTEIGELLPRIKPAAQAVRKALEMDDLARRETELTEAKVKLDEAKASEAEGKPRISGEELREGNQRWEESQSDLAKELGQIVKETPGGQKSVMEQDQKVAELLAAEAKETAQEQAALAQSTEQLEKLRKVEQALAEVAQAQEKLAQKADEHAFTRDQAPVMTEAAKDIRAASPEAIPKQTAAENALAQKAKQLAEAQIAAQLAAATQQGDKQQAQAQQPAKQAPPAGPEDKQTAAALQGGAKQEQPAAPAPQQGTKQEPQAAQQQAGGEQPPQQAAPRPAAPEPKAEQVAAMATEQKELREKTSELLAQHQELVKGLEEKQEARLQAEQSEVAKQAQELAQQVAEVAPQADHIEKQAAESTAAAAKALQADKMEQAAETAAKAGEQLAELSERLEAAATDQLGPDAEAKPPQQESAKTAAEAAQQPSPQGPQPAQQSQQQGEQGKQAAQQGQQSAQQSPKQGEQGKQAAQQGQQQGGKAQQEDRPSAAELAQDAGALAKRQQQLAGEMQALAEGKPREQAVSQQEAVAERAAEMADAARLIQEHAGQLNLPGNVQQQAGQASQQTDQARQQAAKAAEQFEKLQPEQRGKGGQTAQAQQQGSAAQQQQAREAAAKAAQQAQQASAQALNTAAQALDGLSKSLAQEAARASARAPDELVSTEQTAEAYKEAGEAARSKEAVETADAAQELRSLAGQAAQQAAQKGGSIPTVQRMSYAAMGGDPKKGTGPQPLDLSAAELKKLGIELEDWARLPGELRSQILQAAQNAGPEEYRPLIKRYFREIAKRGGKESKKE